MSTKALTQISVKNAAADGAARREIPDAGCRGLYLVVQPSGGKSWAVRYRFAGRPDKLTLGPVLLLGRGEAEPTKAAIGAPLTLAAARKLAAETLHKVRTGVNPQEAKRASKIAARISAGETFQVVAENYFKREGDKLRTTEKRKANLERLVYPAIGNRQIGDIKRSEIVRLLDHVEDTRGAAMADTILATVRRVMTWHASRSDDFRSPIVRGMTRTKTQESARDRILSDDELRRIWATAEAGGQPFDLLVQFLLATGARRTEAARMRWDELEGADWTLPAERNKAKVDLVRPLSALALAVLAQMPRGEGPFVFSTTGGARPLSGYSKFKAAFDRACGCSGWRLHDCRRSARSWMSRAGVNSDHAELYIGHLFGGIRQTYDRHQYHAEKQRVGEALATLISRILDPQPNVAMLHATGQG
jgi:integrase